MSECKFCEPDVFKDRVITEDKYFRIVPVLGQSSRCGGHVIIVPREHFPCLAVLNSERLEHLKRMEAQTRKAITLAYGIRPLFFEHGIAGQTVPHAHLHAVPSSYDPTMDILDNEQLPGSDTNAEVTKDWENVHMYYSIPDAMFQTPYLYWQPQTGGRYMLQTTDAPPRFFLSLLAQKRPLEFHSVDWRNRSPEEKKQDESLISETMTKLTAAWHKIAPPQNF